MIHTTAIVHPTAKLADSVSIGPYSVIGPEVEIGENTQIDSHVVIKSHTRVGTNNRFFQFCSIGEDCQDKKYAGETTWLEIGDNNVFRECVTVHRGTAQDSALTKVGSNGLFMAYAHIAHDCILGDNIIMANNVTLAGHIHVGDHVIIGGLSAIHQFCHIGAHSFIAGGSIVLRDVPPYVMIGGLENKPHGINSEGLKRRNFDADRIRQIRRAYKILYRQGLRAEEAVEQITELAEGDAVIQLMADFVANSTRGIVR